MDIDRKYLEKRSGSELRNLARARKLIPAGTRQQLIDRILNYENKNEKIAISTPRTERNLRTTSTKEEKELSPRKAESKPLVPEPQSLLNNLPADIQGVTALNLSYEDVLNLCKTSKRLANICNNPDFWRRKILKDFGNRITSKYLESGQIKPENLRAKYEQLYAVKLRENAQRYSRTGYKDDPRWKKYEEERKAIKDKKDKLEKDMALVLRSEELLMKEYRTKGNKLQQQAEALLKRSSSKLPIKYEHKYFDIKALPQNIEALADIDFKFPQHLAKYLYKKGLTNVENNFKIGNLIGISDINLPREDPPIILFYITDNLGIPKVKISINDNPSDPVYEYPMALETDIHKQNYKAKDIKRLYNLPFDTSELDEGMEEDENYSNDDEVNINDFVGFKEDPDDSESE